MTTTTNRKRLAVQDIDTDFLIIGGGAAGCWAALTFSRLSAGGSALIVEKATIERSGCLAAGVNALNAYILPGRRPEEYVDYARRDAEDIVCGDLLLSMARGLNDAVHRLENLGLTIQKDEAGRYVARGDRNIKINGENIKPLLADAVRKAERVAVLERVNAVAYAVEGDRIAGLYAVGVDNPVFYRIRARAVLCATGGAAGLYRPNNPGFSRHKMWYPPFNTGAGYAMGIRAGAEMTTFEMRFVALRCKDTIAPTGTLAQGVGARQINSLGEVYEDRYGLTSSQRVFGTVEENKAGRGPCFLRTEGITPRQDEELYKAYLNMAPSQTLKWIENGVPPSRGNVEIEGTEPYIVGGHTASGYWVDTNRETTIRALFAAGDVAGGCPQKYVSGALAEADIAAAAALRYMDDPLPPLDTAQSEKVQADVEAALNRPPAGEKEGDTIDRLEEAMQAAMDSHAGGIGSGYAFSEESLRTALRLVEEIEERSERVGAQNQRELIHLLELRERLTICRTLIAHLRARQETRWRCFAENTDYPEKRDEWRKFVNSRMENGDVTIIIRDLAAREDAYEH